MNRFNFRAWHGDKMLYIERFDSLGHFDNFDRWFFRDGYQEPDMDLSLADVALMQSTGAEDKNGKEIFEMDIVKWENEHPQTKEIMTSWGLVKWESAAFIIHGMLVHRPFYLPKYGSRQFHWDELEVCGNLYESKELLQKIEALKGKA